MVFGDLETTSAVGANGKKVLTMAEYIERETFLKEIEERYCLPCKEAGKDHSGCKCRACWVDDMRGDVICAPAADVDPVVHGRWEPGNPICPVCGGNKFKDLDADIWADWEPPYCPNCGAKMDLER